MQNKPSEISNNALLGIPGLLCAEQDVGNLKKWTFRNFGTPVRRTKRRTSQTMHFQNFWDSCAQNRTSEISKTCTFRNSSDQNKLRCLGQNLFGWDTPSGDHVLSQHHPTTPQVFSGQPWAPSCSSRPDGKTHFAT